MDYKRREFAAALNLVGNFGTEHVMADVEVASFLGDILPISRAANEVEQSSPRVAYLCKSLFLCHLVWVGLGANGFFIPFTCIP